MSLLDGRAYALKLFEQHAEWKETEKPREKNILGKSIQALKIELNDEAITKAVSESLIIIKWNLRILMVKS